MVAKNPNGYVSGAGMVLDLIPTIGRYLYLFKKEIIY
jgi:hypothetical protein